MKRIHPSLRSKRYMLPLMPAFVIGIALIRAAFVGGLEFGLSAFWLVAFVACIKISRNLYKNDI